MKVENLQYKDGDLNLHGLVAYDETISGKRPGVVIMPDAFGIAPFVKERAERLAKLGYVGFGADPYGNGLMAKDLQEGIKYAMALLEDPTTVRRRVRAALREDLIAATGRFDPTGSDGLLHGRNLLTRDCSRRRGRSRRCLLPWRIGH